MMRQTLRWCTAVLLALVGIAAQASFVSATVPTNFLAASASAPGSPVTAVEFYNAALDHYFVSALEPDIDALDSGRIAGWYRTGQTFRVYASGDIAGATP